MSLKVIGFKKIGLVLNLGVTFKVAVPYSGKNLKGLNFENS